MSERLLAEVVQLTGSLAAAPGDDSGLRVCLETSVAAVDAEGGTVFLHDPEENVLRFYHAIGRGPDGQPAPLALGLVGATLAVGEGIAGQVFETREAQIVNDVASDPDHCTRFDEEIQFTTRSVAAIPLALIDGSVIGVLQVLNKRAGDFTEEDVTTLNILARIVALALYHRPQPAAAEDAEGAEDSD